MKIVAALILMKLGTGGAASVMSANFVKPIVEEFGVEVNQFTMMISINAVAMALLYTTASKFLTSKRIGIVMGVASACEVIGLALMSTYHSVYMFYFSGALIGAAQAFTGFVAIPIICNMWFKKKTGTVLGVVMAASYVAAVGYNLLSAQLITNLGWRSAYQILAVMGLVITVPAVFVIMKSPEEAGVLPYGAELARPETDAPAKEEYGLTRKQAFKLPLLYVAWIACILISYGSGVAGYLTPFATMELGQSINFGARAAVIMSFGAILSSLVLGWINDKFGVKAGLFWGAATTAVGYSVMFLSYNSPAFVYIAGFIVGLSSSMYAVQCPLLARSVVGGKHFPGVWSVMMIANSLIGGGLYSSIALFYDKTGTYKGAFIMAIGLFAAAFIIGSIAVTMSRRLKAVDDLIV
ncbi:MAG: MFS transporter [Oscillospiraceae bacterium]|jgi:MFS family permease|nr:MFS transporter [Oscillospiraceae bacterium]